MKDKLHKALLVLVLIGMILLYALPPTSGKKENNSQAMADTFKTYLQNQNKAEEKFRDSLFKRLAGIEKKDYKVVINNIGKKYEKIFNGIDSATASELDSFFTGHVSPVGKH